MSGFHDFPPPVTLPDELALLLHRADGRPAPGRPDLLIAAAELGELALRDRVELTGTRVAVLDPRGTGIDWADELLGLLVRRAGPRGRPVELTGLLTRRLGRFRAHRELLVRQGALRREPYRLLGFIPDDRFHPVPPAREALVERVRAGGRRAPEDVRTVVLCALVHVAGIARSLGCDRDERAALASLAKGEGLGEAVRRRLAAVTAVPVVTAAAAAGAGGR
ncbi:GOLPH3/VPS74 family protein [Saccharopolyspora sp. MS10]|uniref:GOLPH3/VPS74 family protein n=1 Tax=Saccharopolyspora sp. MS10 TaxID=3385973 RepID=UPI0039A1A698